MALISLFSGAGGLDLGFHKAGFATIVANEYDPAICPTFRANFPDVNLIEGDIRCLDAALLPKDIEGIHELIINTQSASSMLFTLIPLLAAI